MKKIIKVEAVEKHFGNQVIIPPLSLDIKEGEFLTILGPSGCGKTTLLRMIAGFETPTKGNLLLDDERINDLPPYKRHMNLVFQHILLTHMNTSLILVITSLSINLLLQITMVIQLLI